MTVNELMQKLVAFPGEAKVFIPAPGQDAEDICEVDVVFNYETAPMMVFLGP